MATPALKSSPKINLGQQLMRARKREGLSQSALAEKLGVAPPTIGNWEARPDSPPLLRRLLPKIVEILGPLDPSKTDLPTTPASDFGTWLRKLRSEKNLTVPELAQRAGVTPPAIYNIEAGKSRNPQASTRERLSRALEETVPEDIINEIATIEAVEGIGVLTDFDPHSHPNDWPQQDGVYVLYDVSERPIYVGKGAPIAKRLRDHSEKFWYRPPIVSYGSYISVGDRRLRHQLEQTMIKFLKSNAVVNQQSTESFDPDA